MKNKYSTIAQQSKGDSMLRRRPAYPYSRLKDWADSGEALHLRCEACAAEARLKPASLIARHGWHGGFAKAVGGIACVECGGATEVVRTAKDPARLMSSMMIQP